MPKGLTLTSILRSYIMMMELAWPLIAIFTVAALALLLNPWMSARAKRIILCGIPLFPLMFLSLGFMNLGIFTLMPEPSHPWHTKHTSPFWLLCSGFIGLPTILLRPLTEAIGLQGSRVLALLLSASWIGGLTALMWKFGKSWFPSTNDNVGTSVRPN